MLGPVAYIGGKNRLAREIISLFPPHKTYVEAFAGGAQVFFRKEPSKVEVLNDLDYEVVNFFRVCQAHYEELVRYLRFIVVSRKWYELLKSTDPTTLTDIARAARFLYLQKNSFGGMTVKQNFRCAAEKTPNLNPAKIPTLIEATHQRLSCVLIESLPYDRILKKYDRPTTLFYLDPPYWERKLYKFNFSAADFIALEQRLHALKGKFILSLDDHPGVRTLFKSFQIVSTQAPIQSNLEAATAMARY